MGEMELPLASPMTAGSQLEIGEADILRARRQVVFGSLGATVSGLLYSECYALTS
ncbi:MAG: hypothetical protein MI919_24985 [Holophagales bacterium]|nr:hypothetical protein [Holophagales bacterium]